MNYSLIASLIVILSLSAPVSARTPLPPPSIADVSAAYRQYHEITLHTLVTPAIIEASLPRFPYERTEVAVLNTTTNTFEPSYVRVVETSAPTRPRVTTVPSVGAATSLVDQRTETYAEFALSGDTIGRAEITLSYDRPITASSITTLLDAYVALPTTIEIRAMIAGADTIVVAATPLRSTTIQFPKTTAATWRVIYTYGQPLRISELRIEDTTATPASYLLRFLAQPGESYRVFVNPDRLARPMTGESAQLASASEVTRATLGPATQNPVYAIADTDGDSIPDVRDNCVSTPNSDQLDVNQNSRGDVCDDFDQDGIVNASDNCPEKPNVAQTDTDSDSIGDVCDGEESRLTERYPWLPWMGLGLAALILIALFALALRTPPAPPADITNDPQI